MRVKESGENIVINAERGKTYVVRALASMTLDAPDLVVAQTPFDATATVAAHGRTLPGGQLALDLPEGWTAEPASVRVPAISSGRSKEFTFSVTPAAGQVDFQPLVATLTGDGWTHTARTGVSIEPLPPCPYPPADGPLVAWDPTSGSTVDDGSAHNRDATVQGSAAYDTTAPTGSGVVLDGQSYLRTAPTSLGFLRQATFATEVKVSGLSVPAAVRLAAQR